MGYGDGGGSQTPWLTNINANNFALFSVSSIGIAVATPAYPLHVSGTTQPLALFKNTANTPSIELQDSATTPNRWWLACGIGSTTDGVFGIYDARQGVNRLAITQAGNVGIGVNTPSAKFVVSGAGSSGGGITDVQVVGSSNVGAGINLVSTDTGGKNWALISAGSALGAGAFGIFDATLGSYAMFISSAHNIGIGTTSPVNTVHIHVAANQNIGLRSNLSRASIGAFSDPASGSANAWLGFDGSGFDFEGGNVGIGTLAPRSLLSIIGPNAATPGSATQFTIGEVSNNSAYGLAVGYYFDSSTSAYKGVIQSTSNAPGPLLLNPSGGNVGIGTATPGQTLHVFGTGIALNTSNASYYRIAPSADQTTLQIGYWVSGAWYTTGGLQLSFTGNLGIGKAAAYTLDVAGDVNCTGAFRVNGVAIGGGGISGVGWLASGAAVSTRPNCNFTAGGTVGFSVTDVAGSNRVDVMYSVGSDVRLKRNLVPLTGGLDLINRLRPYEFEYNGLAGRRAGPRAVSILAQDLQEIYPQGVTTYPAKLRPDDTEMTDLLTFDPLDILCHAALAIQQLAARIETLEKRLKGN